MKFFIKILLTLSLFEFGASANANNHVNTVADFAHIIDFESNRVLMSKNADSAMKPASMAKIMTLYIVSSRFEGGPQSILECAATKTPIISTDVGIAKEILNVGSIFNMENFLDAKADVEYAYKNVEKFFIPNGIENFNNYFKSLL